MKYSSQWPLPPHQMQACANVTAFSWICVVSGCISEQLEIDSMFILELARGRLRGQNRLTGQIKYASCPSRIQGCASVTTSKLIHYQDAGVLGDVSDQCFEADRSYGMFCTVETA